MIIGKEQCTFELYIINYEKYTDYDIGDRVSEPVGEDKYDCFTEDACEVAHEIAEKLYKDTSGQFKYIIEIHFTHTKYYDYYYGAYEYDIDYEYSVVSKEPTEYFDYLQSS